jgi:predicted permease
VEILSVWDTGFDLFCAGATVLSILLALLIARLTVKEEVRGAFVQASYRSSASLLGMAYMENLYGEASMGSLMMVGSVPIYNIAAVLILSFLKPGGGKMQKGQFVRVLKGVVTNPIILGIVFGCIASLLPFSMPHIVSKALSDIGKTATPLGLMAMGAQVEFKSVRSRAGSAVLASVMKLMVFAVLFLPAAVALGFRREKLIAVMVMLGSATTVAGYIMAKNMGHEGTLTQTAVMLTTLLSSFTMTFWIYLMRTLGYL